MTWGHSVAEVQQNLKDLLQDLWVRGTVAPGLRETEVDVAGQVGAVHHDPDPVVIGPQKFSAQVVVAQRAEGCRDADRERGSPSSGR